MINISDTYLDKQRTFGDPKVDQMIREFFDRGDRQIVYDALRVEPGLLMDDISGNPVVDFLRRESEQPTWYDEDRILKGQRLFRKYAAEIMTMLGVLSLPYCYAGTPGNKALYLSDKMRQSPGKRLTDTAEFTLGVSQKGNLTKRPIGRIQISRTRLIHAIARYYVLKGEWKVEWGMPINQEDMAGTNLAFSYIVINGLRKSGHLLTDKEKEDFIYLWKYIGYQLGIVEDLLPDSYHEAHLLNNAIKRRNFGESIEGRELTKELVSYFKSVAPPDQVKFVTAQMRYFLGDKVSDLLGLPTEKDKDRLTKLVNGFRELQHYVLPHGSSYQNMLINYRQFKSTS